MKAIYVFLCLVFAATLNAAVPDYKAFRGTGGVTVTSNPPNGTIVIDGSGISAGALPTFAITNNWDGPTFTNRVAMRQVGNVTNLGNMLFSSTLDSASISSILLIENTDADQANRIDFIRIEHADQADADIVYGAFISDSGGAPTEDYKFGQTEFVVGAGIPVHFISAFTIDSTMTMSGYLTNALLRVGAGGIIQTQTLGANLTMGADGVLSASGGSGTPAGSTADIQFNEGGVFAGTNRLRYVRADNMIQVIGTGASESNQTRAKIVFTNDSQGVGTEFNASGVSLPQGQTFQFNTGPAGAGWGTNFLMVGLTGLRPAVTDSLDLGITGNRWKSLWVTRLASLGSIFTTGYVHSAGAHVATEFSTTNSTPGSATAALTLSATNLTQAVRIQGAHQMTRLVTNIVGILEVATNDIATSVFTIDCDKQHEVNMTNRIGFAFTAMITNGVPGQRIKGRFIGTASGGANHIVTFAGQGLFLNSYDISANPATSLAVTVTNGYLLEYDIAINKDNGTNTFDTIYAYKKY